MLSGITISGFAGCYAIALALEVSRYFFRTSVRAATMLGFAGLGMLLHTAFLGWQAAHATASPLSSKEDFYLVAAWVLAMTYLYLAACHPKTALGVYVLPLVLGLVGVGTFLAESEPFAREPASKVWGAIHGMSVLLATVTVLIGFAAGLMYLVQAHRLKRKLPPPGGLRLPTLEWLQRTNSISIVASMLMMGVGILSGVVLNLIQHEQRTGRVPWNDPFVLSTFSMFAWLLLASLIGLFYRPAREGRKVAYLTVVGFVFLVLALGVGLFVDSQHGGMRRREPEGPGAGSARSSAGPIGEGGPG